MQLILVCRAHRLFLFAKKAGDSAVNGDGKIQDFAELWVGANRSRALILMQYIPIVGTALSKRVGKAWRKVAPIQLPTRPAGAIAERAVRSSRT
jgi:hypothetical protein